MVFPRQGKEEGAQNENTYVYMQSAVKGGEAQLVMRERRVWRSAVELYDYTLRHAVVHCLGDSRDRREGNGAQGDEAFEGAEGNEDGVKGAFCMPVIWP